MNIRETLEVADDHIKYIGRDARGTVLAFGNKNIDNLHVASVKPGALRGNHVHDCDEILCVMGGAGSCEITLEESSSGTIEQFLVQETVKTYQIKAGIKHSVRNIGEKEFYLTAFLTTQVD